MLEEAVINLGGNGIKDCKLMMDKKKRKYILSNISNYLHVHTIFTLLPGRSTSSSCPPYTTRTADLGKAEPRFEDSQCTNGSMSHF